MEYNKSEIMKEAWRLYRNGNRNTRGELMGTFANALCCAWKNAKWRARQNNAESLFQLRMKDRWSRSDYEAAYMLNQGIKATA